MLSQTTCLPRNSTSIIQTDISQAFSLPIASLGPIDPDTVVKVEVVVTDEEKARQERMAQRPPLTEILNLHDFEVGDLLCNDYRYSLNNVQCRLLLVK